MYQSVNPFLGRMRMYNKKKENGEEEETPAPPPRKNNPTFDSSRIGTTHTQRAEEEFKTEYNRSFSSEERYSIIFLSNYKGANERLFPLQN